MNQESDMINSAQALDESWIPEPLLPVHLLELLYRRHSLEGERLLAFAVLKDALNCYLRPVDSSERGRRLFHEAEDWINRKGARSLFSFDHVCQTLDIEPGYLRNGLHRCRAQNRQPSFPRAARAHRQ
jgi:hypothetical protein